MQQLVELALRAAETSDEETIAQASSDCITARASAIYEAGMSQLVSYPIGGKVAPDATAAVTQRLRPVVIEEVVERVDELIYVLIHVEKKEKKHRQQQPYELERKFTPVEKEVSVAHIYAAICFYNDGVHAS